MPPKRSTGTGVSYTDGDDERLRELNRAHQRQYRERRKEKFRLLEERVQLLERELARVRQSGSVYPPSTSPSIGLPAESSTSLLSLAPSNDEDQVPSIALDPDADQVPPTQQNLAQIRARLIAVEAENTAYKVMLRQQRNFLLQSYLQNLPPIPPTPTQQLHQPPSMNQLQ
ncbi:hypothetical protein BCR33DRAFT_169768 [Rhizoclosmatium globosum]|uniref:BZIP domain-containing protein n=1 Tax=Rhizoclosmatium globosum TaxID=329046 RepID=A0A1Y2CEN6_9FUNG|nr:hypothetical protein BCR33DRAFT_169768 [Rhizoclosmatium globosum]|eukprot:ORY45530.1 hypothetical protein BCR33DRAFT_169768 [Rhizoclosmatium globosum]